MEHESRCFDFNRVDEKAGHVRTAGSGVDASVERPSSTSTTSTHVSPYHWQSPERTTQRLKDPAPVRLSTWHRHSVIGASTRITAVMALLPSWHRHLRGLFITIPWLAWLLGADIVLSLLLPLKLVAPRLVYDASSLIASSVWAWIQLIFTRLNGARISLSGDRLPTGESAIVVVNHVAWSDFYMIQALAQNAGMLGRCRYFAKKQLRAVPFLGWGLWAIGMPMVTRTWLKDKDEMDRVFSSTVQGQLPICKPLPSCHGDEKRGEKKREGDASGSPSCLFLSLTRRAASRACQLQ